MCIRDSSRDPDRNIIPILISDDSEYIYPALLDDIHTTLVQEGFSSQIYVTENETVRERQFLEELLKNPPRGLIAEDVYKRQVRRVPPMMEEAIAFISLPVAWDGDPLPT